MSNLKIEDAPFALQTIDSAPQAAKLALENLKRSVGAIPNLAGMMANSALMITAFVTLRETIQNLTTFSEKEMEMLLLTNAHANNCKYCQAIHSTFALNKGISQGTVDAVRSARELDDEKLNALSAFTRKTVVQRGQLSKEDFDSFYQAGYKPEQALEVIAILASSVLANYTNHFTNAPIDKFLEAQYRE